MIAINPVDYLKSKGVDYLYHFTELKNLNSIIRYGLLSREELKRRGQSFHDGALADIISWREHIGISSYVPFHLCPRVPMLYMTEGVKKKEEIKPHIPHIPRPVYFLLDPRVLIDKNAILTDGHPKDTNIYGLNELDKIDYDTINQDIVHAYGTDEFAELKNRKQAEILIDTLVEPRYIKKICLRSIGEFKIAQEYLKGTSIGNFIFEVRPDLFSRRKTYLVDYTVSNEYDITVELRGYNSYQSERVEYYYSDGSKKETNCNKYLTKGTFKYDPTWGKPVSAIYYINDTEIFKIKF